MIAEEQLTELRVKLRKRAPLLNLTVTEDSGEDFIRLIVKSDLIINGVRVGAEANVEFYRSRFPFYDDDIEFLVWSIAQELVAELIKKEK